MTTYTERFAEQWESIDFLMGDAVAANTESNTGYNSCANYHRIVVIIIPVDINDILDVDIEQATDTSGTSGKSFDSGSKDISIALADTLPSIIEIRPEEFDIANAFDCLNVEVTTANSGGNGNDFAVWILGAPKFQPAATTNVDSVTD